MMSENSVFEQLALWNPHGVYPQETLSSGRARGAVYTRQERMQGKPGGGHELTNRSH